MFDFSNVVHTGRGHLATASHINIYINPSLLPSSQPKNELNPIPPRKMITITFAFIDIKKKKNPYRQQVRNNIITIKIVPLAKVCETVSARAQYTVSINGSSAYFLSLFSPPPLVPTSSPSPMSKNR